VFSLTDTFINIIKVKNFLYVNDIRNHLKNKSENYVTEYLDSLSFKINEELNFIIDDKGLKFYDETFNDKYITKK
jgi:hypothetical protein